MYMIIIIIIILKLYQQYKPYCISLRYIKIVFELVIEAFRTVITLDPNIII